MRFMGSKTRIAKHILPLMLAERKPNQWWVEPFVGGGNMIDKVTGPRIGSDIDAYVIEALIAIRDNIDDLPKNSMEFTEEDYKKLRQSDDYEYKGYAGYAFSYGGKWLGGWSRDKERKRDYVKEAFNNAVKQHNHLQRVHLYNKEYNTLTLPKESLIYCDPPYQGTPQYQRTFNHDRFWEWCIAKHLEGHTVFVSEYSAPSGFECIWEKPLVSSLTKETGSKQGTERLFRCVI